jgi:GAF domain-containing protein
VTSLHELVEALGPDVIRVPVAPRGLDAAFDRVVVYDVLDAPDFRGGDLVLCVGVPAETGFALRTVHGGATALLMRHDGPLPERLVQEAMTTGVCLLTLSPACTWAQVHEVILSMPSHAMPVAETSLAGTELMEDLFAIANAMAEQVGAPVTIEDNQARLLAYSARHEGVDDARAATILGHRTPDPYRKEIRRLGIAKRLLTEIEPFHVVSTLPGIRSRMIVAIRARDEVLGSVWALSDEPFDEEARAAFSQAARSAAVRLLHHRLTSDLQRQQQAAMLSLLLMGSDSAIESARRSGLTGDSFRVLAIGTTDGEAPDDELLERCLSALTMRLSLTAAGASTGRVDDAVYCVLPTGSTPAQGLAEAREIALKLSRGLDKAHRQRVVMGISGDVASLGELPHARDEADRVLQVLRRSGGGIADADEVALQLTLLRLGELGAGRSSRTERLVASITAHDDEHATHYYETLHAHLAAFGDPTEASRRLGVHTNTLRYRIRRLHEVFGLDLADDDVRFALMLHLRLREG